LAEQAAKSQFKTVCLAAEFLNCALFPTGAQPRNSGTLTKGGKTFRLLWSVSKLRGGEPLNLGTLQGKKRSLPSLHGGNEFLLFCTQVAADGHPLAAVVAIFKVPTVLK